MKHFFKFLFFGLFLLGLTFTSAPILQTPYHVESEEEVSSQKTRNNFPVPKELAEQFITSTDRYAELEAIKDFRAGRDVNAPLLRVLDDSSEPIPDDTAHALSFDFGSDRRVNTPNVGLQFHPDVTMGTDGIIYACWAERDGFDQYRIYAAKSVDNGVSFNTGTVVYGPSAKPVNRPVIGVYGTGATARVYVAFVFWDNYDGSRNYDKDIFLRYSTNGGASFPNAVAISSDGNYSDYPEIKVDASNYVYVGYTYAYFSGGGCSSENIHVHIAMSVSPNGGSSWHSTRYISNTSNDEYQPRFAIFGSGNTSTLHCIYAYDFDTGSGTDYDVLYRRITNAGSSSPSIGSPVSISSFIVDEFPGSVDLDPLGNPHIAYTRGGNTYYRRSTNGGITFGTPIAIDPIAAEQVDAKMATDGEGNPIIVWRDERTGSPNILMSYSNDRGVSFSDPMKVNQDVGTNNQYWPAIASVKSPWTRHISIVWWDTRWDEGDIVYNGNYQKGLRLHVTMTPDYPPFDPLKFEYWSFNEEYEELFTVAGTYDFWYDTDRAWSPLLQQYWSRSTPYERWACENPGGWSTVPYIYLKPPDAGGEFNVDYYHQYNVVFWPEKGNPDICDATMPDVGLEYTSFGTTRETACSYSVIVNEWVDGLTHYSFEGWFALDPNRRWAGVSEDTLGYITESDTIRPLFFLQFRPLIHLVGPTHDNTVCIDDRWLFGEDYSECELHGSWQDWVDCGTEFFFSDTTEWGWSAVDSNRFIPLDYFTTTIRYRWEELVVIRNDFPEHGVVNVDGSTVASPDSNLWGPATVHTIAAISPQEFGDTTRYHFSHWSDGGAFSHEITVPEHSITFTAYFDPHYKITLEHSGITGGHTPVLTGEGWYEGGTWAPITATAGYDSLAGVRYGFSHWSSIPEGAIFEDPTSEISQVMVNRPYRIVANYAVQYSLEVINPDGYGYPNPPTGMNWFDVGSTVELSAGSPDTTDHMYCYAFSGTGSVPHAGTASELSITITEPSTVTWYWDNQPRLTVISPWSIPSPSVGNHWYDPGTFVEASVMTPFYLSANHRYVCTGYEGTSTIGDGSATEIGFIITEDCTLRWLWQEQWRLVITNPGGYGSPIPPVGEHWYDAGSLVSCWVNSPDGIMHCVGYTGSGSVIPSSGPHDSVAFHIAAPTAIQWNWASSSEVVSLTIYSDYGSPTPSGMGWYAPGTPVTCSVTSPHYPVGMDGWRYNCTGFTGTGSAPISGTGSSTGSWTIWTNSEVHWHWEEEVRLEIASIPPGIGMPDPDFGEHWYSPGTFIYGEVEPVFEDSMDCTGYIGTGSFSSATTNFFEGEIHNPSSITWVWEVDNVTLTISSDYDGATYIPARGEHVYGSGTVVTAKTDSAIYLAPWERYKCVGFTGTGGVPSGIGDSVTFVMVADGELTWLWEHQYRFTVTNPDGHGTPEPDVGDHWISSGTLVHCRIYPNPSGEYYCVGYTGSGILESEAGVSEFSFVMTGRAGCEWHWVHASDMRSLFVTSEYGSPYPRRGIHYYAADAVIEARMDSAIYYLASDNRQFCEGGTGTGSVPASFSDTVITFTLTHNSSIEWDWTQQYTLQILNPEGLGTPSPPVGTYWYDEFDHVECSNSLTDGAYTCIGYNAVGSIGSGYGNHVEFLMTAPTALTWLWEEADDLVQLIVDSDYGFPVPSVGVSYIPSGTLVNARVDSFVYTSAGERYRCIGFSGRGSIPDEGSGNSISFVITEDTRLTWEWEQEFYLRMMYFGCGSLIPMQSGENWYPAGTEADIWTEPSVYDSDEDRWYGFMRWQQMPSTIPVENIYHHPTTVTVIEPCTLVALYNIAVPCTLRTDSAYTWAAIYADGEWYEETHEKVFWWGVGSMHDIQVLPSFDTLGIRYVFDEWSDGGGLHHTVGPITTPASWTANYRKQFALTIEKDPPQEYGELYFNSDTLYRVSSFTNWVDEGATAVIGCSSPDGTPDHRFIFDYWSDGGAIVHETDPITEPQTITAYYNDEFLLRIRKNPIQYYGSITVNDTVHSSTAEILRWYPRGTEVSFAISFMDIGTDSLWLFSHWNDDPSDTDSMKTLVMDTSYFMIANYDGDVFVLEFSASCSIWNLDTVDVYSITPMEPVDVFRLVNNSTIPVDYGLVVEEATDTWRSSCTVGPNRFAVRAIFTSDALSSGSFSYIYDCVKPFHSWATSAVFGGEGYSIPPGGEQYLWLEFAAPVYSSIFEIEEVIIMRLNVRPRAE